MKRVFSALGVILIAGSFTIDVAAQDSAPDKNEGVPKGWHLKDLQKDGFYGISLDQAYDFLKSKGRKSTPVIVGIVDSGIDTTHEDLKPVLWVNTKEIPGNGIDDDKNGYIDDINGWNFLGSKDGKQNVTKDSYEGTRVYWKYKKQFEGKSEKEIPAADKETYKMWLRSQQEIGKNLMDAKEFEYMTLLVEVLKEGDSIIKKELKKDVYTCNDLTGYTPLNAAAHQLKQVMMGTCKLNNTQEITNNELIELSSRDLVKASAGQTPPVNYRGDIVQDNYADINDKYYGNGNVYVDNESAKHGTHVAGIVGAVRNNGLGMDGVADNVKLMSIRAVPDGDEHDKDIALGIRYAVDNGARVINMSFGKGFSPEKKWVDDAVKYAESKNVLLVHAAGNDAANVDTAYNFPAARFADGKRPQTWITIGASGDPKAGGLTASFSNYGKKEVDIFSPGVKIYSTVPGGNTYADLQGTSMAAPVVSGVAALIMSYYPNLSAVQVKNILEKSASKPADKVKNPGGGPDVNMSDLAVYGGIVNAYKAVQLADEESRMSKITPVKKTARRAGGPAPAKKKK